MSSFITAAYVKDRFPLWKEYCDSSVTTLQAQIDEAENEFSYYIKIEPGSITDFFKQLIFFIVRKRCFDLLNGDKEFEHYPQIIKDYEKAVAILKEIKAGGNINGTIPSTSETGSVSMKSDRKIFDDWFTKRGPDISEMGGSR